MEAQPQRSRMAGAGSCSSFFIFCFSFVQSIPQKILFFYQNLFSSLK